VATTPECERRDLSLCPFPRRLSLPPGCHPQAKGKGAGDTRGAVGHAVDAIAVINQPGILVHGWNAINSAAGRKMS